MRLSKKLTILLIVLGTVIIMPNCVQAAFQSIPEKKNGTNANDLFVGCRQMETTGGVLGLNENLNEDYTGSTENGIDAHMVLNTEWGTVAMFADSLYGAGKELSGLRNGTTSTGNATGIYGLVSGDNEVTASLYNGEITGNAKKYTNIVANSNSRYFNSYTSGYNDKKDGDAFECYPWLEAWWFDNVNSSGPMFTRNRHGLFGVDEGYSGCTRAVVVCAEGL